MFCRPGMQLPSSRSPAMKVVSFPCYKRQWSSHHQGTSSLFLRFFPWEVSKVSNTFRVSQMKRPELLMGGYRVVHCKRFRAMAIIVHDNSMKISSQASPLETLLSIGLMEPLDSHVSVGPSNGTGAAGSGNTGIVFADVETMEVKQNHLSNSSPQTKKVRVPWNKGKRHSPGLYFVQVPDMRLKRK